MANFPRVLMKIEVDGEEYWSEDVRAFDKESLDGMAQKCNPDIREGRATLSTILVFSRAYGDYIELVDSHRFISGDKFRLIYRTGQLQRSRPASSGWIANNHDGDGWLTSDDDSYHIRGTLGDEKIDLSVNKGVAIGIGVAVGVGVGVGAVFFGASLVAALLGTSGSGKKMSK